MFVKKGPQCWLWTGSIDGKGYGRIRQSEKMFLVHRLMYEIENGPIPQGKLACHVCDIKLCCRPSHIFVGDAKDNAIDAIKKGLKFGRIKLTESVVRKIRSLYIKGTKDHGTRSLSKQFEMSKSEIAYIVNKSTWKHVI